MHGALREAAEMNVKLDHMNRCYLMPEMTAEAVAMLRRAYEYIEERRPYESWTLAILNEKAYDIEDITIGEGRSRLIN